MRYSDMVEQHKRLTETLEKVDRWIDELNSGVTLDFEMRLRGLALELGRDDLFERFDLGNAVEHRSSFLFSAYAERGQTTYDLDRITKQMRERNYVITHYGEWVLYGLCGMYPALSLYSEVYEIPRNEWYFQPIKPQTIDWTAPLEPAMTLDLEPAFHIVCKKIVFFDKTIRCDYIAEIDSLFVRTERDS